MVASDRVLEELSDVLRRDRFRRYLTLEAVDELIAALRREVELVEDPAEVPAVTRDPDDDYLVALARSSGADALVSGDADLASLEKEVARVLTPRQALDLLERSGRA